MQGKNTSAASAECYLRSYIPQGKANAKTQATLAKELGVTPETVKAEITKARKAGELIANCGKGYFYPESVEESQAFINNLTSQAKSRLRTAKPFRKAIASEKQTVFEEWEV